MPHKKYLLGLGLDHHDGHKRITRGDNFLLVGGSKETHDEMREKTIKLNELLKKKRETLDTVNKASLAEFCIKAGFKPISPPLNPSSK